MFRRELLGAKGQRIELKSDGAVVLDSRDPFGMIAGFTDRAIPNGTRVSG